MKTSLPTLMGALILASAAQAQDTQSAPPAAAPAPASPAAPNATFSPGDIQKFAKAAVALNKIQTDTTIAAADKQQRMAAAVQAQGLEPQKFNEIAQAAQTDTALQQQIQAAAAQPK
jgi:hypothetical protein